MPREHGKEWKHVKLIQCGKGFISCLRQTIWIASGTRIRAHLGVKTLSGISKCEKVLDNVVNKVSGKSETTEKRFIENSSRKILLVKINRRRSCPNFLR